MKLLPPPEAVREAAASSTRDRVSFVADGRGSLMLPTIDCQTILVMG